MILIEVQIGDLSTVERSSSAHPSTAYPPPSPSAAATLVGKALKVGWKAGDAAAPTTSSRNLMEVGATAETRVWVWSL